MKTDNSRVNVPSPECFLRRYRVDPSDTGSEMVEEFVNVYTSPVTGKTEYRHVAFRDDGVILGR